jgi:DNA repair protein SbcC/Rad50
MIPRRIKLSGFLSYKDEQEISFDGASLWMLAGLNGTGKSSIFDAMTYALFGHHRGGALNAGELINKDSKALSVEFEFLVDGQPFRILRTLRKDARGGTKGTQNIFRIDATTSKPVAIPDTSLSDGFKNWVREKIGLNFETFTSSVLLLQGRAEKLLDGGPKDRAAVLAGIVDLERYQSLHEKADAKRKAIKTERDLVEGQMTGIPEVTEIELIAADNKIDETEQAKTDATKDADRLQNLEFESRRWAELQARRTGLNNRWQKGETLIGESAAIETAYRRSRELKEVIPHLLIIQEKQRAIEESDRSAQQLNDLKEQTEAQRLELDGSLELCRKKKSSHHVSLMQYDQRLEQIRGQLREMAGPLSQLGNYEHESARLKRLDADLQRLPANLAESVRAAEAAFNNTVELGKVVPLLDQFASTRLQLRDATKRGGELACAEKETREAGEKTKQQHADAKARFDLAAQDRRRADDAVTEARLGFQHAKAAATEFEKLEGSRVCRACGQALTPAHWKLEKVKRDEELTAATAAHAKASAAQKNAVKAETTAREAFEQADRELQNLRDVYRDTTTEARRTREEVERLIEECRLAYQYLPLTYRERVAATPPADWLATKWPTADEQRQFKKEAESLDATRDLLQQLREQLAKYDRLLAQRNSARETVERMQAMLGNCEPAALRKEETNLKAEEEAHAGKVRGTKALIQEADREMEQFSRQLADLQKSLARIESQLNVESATCIQHRDAIERAGKLLPANWREAASKAGLAEQNRWKAELESLDRRGTTERYEELARTRASIDALNEEIALARDEESRVPVEAKRPVEEVKALLARARIAVNERGQLLQAAREEKAILDRQRADREKLRLQSLALDREQIQWTALAQLLGRDRLQRHLVRTAERQIVDYANGILDRLSGGQLFLRLCGGEEGTGAERALELEAYNRLTGESPINVNFLSGSQRFRVAVSLALGIGQYASRQHRPIESVIIDEGFGCLDRNGRQVMIQELQNLRGHLQCILLVSHQEEFADAFADGYRFELTDGATRIKRFQK